MTIKQIEKELERIYKERRSWNGVNNSFNKFVTNGRELVLIAQIILSKLLMTMKNKDNQKELLFKEFYTLCKLKLDL